ncbi:MAG: hypothetical protein KAI06_00725 [Anaerolineales bacterium]|nr:hypothetical protein [Anaerolineales bacterium]
MSKVVWRKTVRLDNVKQAILRSDATTLVQGVNVNITARHEPGEIIN